ncbi:MAG: aminotransferase class I/II-fold pyridoxal phosphate-dependent enzyme [Clostridia bacterium]|nr:aminotransferase class I/II-fold pyridoxal phosphate-dependent enzyme [Clostridia bacterium]
MPMNEKDQPVTQITRFEDTPEYKAFALRMQDMLDTGENPYFICHDSALTDTSVVDGQRLINFGSYNYVGMSGRKEVSEAAKKAIDEYGTSASGSRLISGEKTLYQTLEKEIAEWKRAEACLVLVSGHATNVTVVGNFCGDGDLILYDALAHNSIWEGCRLSRATCRPFPHNDPQALDMILSRRRHKFSKVLIVIEGAYSMDGDIANVPAFVALKKKYGCFLMVDEAHSSCVLGETGGGVDEYFHLGPDDIDIKMGTLSKGLGACGGYLCGKKSLIDYFRYQLPGFVFSVGISPALAAAALTSQRLLRKEPSIMKRLHDNIAFFVAEAKKHRFDICLAGETSVVPVLVGPDDDAFRLSSLMHRAGVYVPPVVFPAVPRGESRLRFCVISEHRQDEMVKALDLLEKVAAENGIVLPRRDY